MQGAGENGWMPTDPNQQTKLGKLMQGCQGVASATRERMGGSQLALTTVSPWTSPGCGAPSVLPCHALSSFVSGSYASEGC